MSTHSMAPAGSLPGLRLGRAARPNRTALAAARLVALVWAWGFAALALAATEGGITGPDDDPDPAEEMVDELHDRLLDDLGWSLESTTHKT